MESPSPWKVAPSLSSSGLEPATFAAFVRRSLKLLRREHPPAYLAMCEALAPARVRLEVDGEVAVLRFKKKKVRMVPDDPGEACVRVETSRALILDLVDGQLGLLQAVERDQLRLYGSLEELVRFHEGLTFYLHGAVRAPSFPGLLRRYRIQGGE